MYLFIAKDKKRTDFPAVLSKDNIHVFPKHIQELYAFLVSLDKPNIEIQKNGKEKIT